MLSFNQQYDIANGIFITYDSQLDHRLLHSKHKQGTRERAKPFFPYQKWETRTKEIFVLACIYIMYKKSPSSFRSMMEELREVDIKDIAQFKHIILNYQDFMSKEVNILKEKFGSSITPKDVLNEFLDGNIQFYTAYWFIEFYNGDWKPGRTYSHILRKLKFIMLFLTFKEESINKVQKLFGQFEI